MKSLIIFPIFVMFILSVLSVSADVYYSGSPAFSGFNSTNSTFGLTYSLLPNGTIIFNTPDTVIVYIHSTIYPNPVLYQFYWNDMAAAYDNGTISFNNGTASIFTGYTWYITTTEWQHWSQVDRLDGMTYYQTLQEFAIDQNNMAMLGSSGEIPIDITAIAAILIIAGVVGITVMGSGISETAQGMIIKGTFLLAIWASLTVTAYALLTSIYFVGSVLWIGLTIMYIAGFVLSIQGGSGE